MRNSSSIGSTFFLVALEHGREKTSMDPITLSIAPSLLGLGSAGLAAAYGGFQALKKGGPLRRWGQRQYGDIAGGIGSLRRGAAAAVTPSTQRNAVEAVLKGGSPGTNPIVLGQASGQLARGLGLLGAGVGAAALLNSARRRREADRGYY